MEGVADVTSPYHRLKRAHGWDSVTLPTDPVLRRFLVSVMESTQFQQCAYEREQVHIVHRRASSCPVKVSYQTIADFFQITKSTVQYHLKRPSSIVSGCTIGAIGRPPLLDGEQLDAVLKFISSRFAQRSPATYDEIRRYIKQKFALIVDVACLRHFLCRVPQIKSVEGRPMEDSRVFVRQEEIVQYFTRIAEIISVAEIPAAFILNIDESGFDRFVDARQITCIVPAAYEQSCIPIPVSRKEQRATLLAAICADGSSMKNMIVLPRKSIDQELFELGYTPDKFHYGHSEKGFMTTRLFREWIELSFIPEIRSRRARYKYEGPVLAIMDGFSVHDSEMVSELFEKELIISIFIPPHSSNQVQPLDLGVFAIQKQRQSNVTVPSDVSTQTAQVIRMMDSYIMAATPKNIIRAFQRGGIVSLYDREKMMLMSRVEPEYAKAATLGQTYDIEEDIGGPRRRVAL